MADFDELLEELKKHLFDTSRQNWLLGAGISYLSNIPLMQPLTDRVVEMVNAAGDAKNIEIIEAIKNDLDDAAHVEHYLSHLGDLIALAERSKTHASTVNGENYSKDELEQLHQALVSAIGAVVRYGYRAGEEPGTAEIPIVEIEHHLRFIKALFRGRANLLSRTRLSFFTTNYDTLLEDALGLEKYDVVDGFSGGAVGFWNPNKELAFGGGDPNQCYLYKLHGSIDWHKSTELGLVRARYGTKYLSDPTNIMIYPQATKYVETQKDPFATLFSGFRSALNYSDQNVLVVCGYSFGDEHINSEIEAALNQKGNKTTLLAFAQEAPSDGITINHTLDKWLQSESFGNRVYVAGEKGIYNRSVTVKAGPGIDSINWWAFSGLTEFLRTGEV